MQPIKEKVKCGAKKFRVKQTILLEFVKSDPKRTKINFGVVNYALKSIDLETNHMASIYN